MKPNEVTEKRWFKSTPHIAVGDGSRIDAENGIIRRVVLASVGEAKGHGVSLEQEFIDDLVKYGQRNFSKTGLKARFGHPSMSNETMGTQLGYFKNFEVDGENAVADLHLLDAANESPTHPGMKNWVLKMAAEKPDHIMSSIVFQPGGYYQRELESRKKRKMKSSDMFHGRFDNYDESLGPVFVELADLYFTDLVEDGAATDNLFSTQFNSEKYAVQVAEFLRENPHLQSFLKENPDKVLDFLAKIGVDHFSLKKPKTAMKTLADFFQKKVEKPVETDETEFDKQFAAANAEMLALNQKVNDLTTSLAAEKQKVADLTTELANANTKIAELSKEPAGELPSGATETEAPKPAAQYGSVTAKAIELSAKATGERPGGGFFKKK
jgi:hypothetical protein